MNNLVVIDTFHSSLFITIFAIILKDFPSFFR